MNNRKERRRSKRKQAEARKRQRTKDERTALRRKTNWALQLSLGCTLMTIKDLYPDFELSKDFFNRLNENIEQATADSHDLTVLFRVIQEEFGFDIRRI